jgi:hypothetical protein
MLADAVRPVAWQRRNGMHRVSYAVESLGETQSMAYGQVLPSVHSRSQRRLERGFGFRDPATERRSVSYSASACSSRVCVPRHRPFGAQPGLPGLDGRSEGQLATWCHVLACGKQAAGDLKLRRQTGPTIFGSEAPAENAGGFWFCASVSSVAVSLIASISLSCAPIRVAALVQLGDVRLRSPWSLPLRCPGAWDDGLVDLPLPPC